MSSVGRNNFLIAIVTGQITVFIIDSDPNYVPTVGSCSGTDQVPFSLATAVAEATAIRRNRIKRVTAGPCERFAGQLVSQSQGL